MHYFKENFLSNDIWIFSDIECEFSEALIISQLFSKAINLNPWLTFSKNSKPSDSILSATLFFLLKILSSGDISKKIVKSGLMFWQTIFSNFLMISILISLP